MGPVERQFPHFAASTLAGLYQAALSDQSVFLLALTGLLLGAPHRRLRGAGVATGLYVTFRRLDQYVNVAIQLGRAASVKSGHD